MIITNYRRQHINPITTRGPPEARKSVGWQVRDDDFLHAITFHRHNERAQQVRLYQVSFLNDPNEFCETRLYACIHIHLRSLALKFICLI
jgi:hypothetical protein